MRIEVSKAKGMKAAVKRVVDSCSMASNTILAISVK